MQGLLSGEEMNNLRGLNFRDETLWRGRMLAFTYAIRATVYELGLWLAALLIAHHVADWWPGHRLAPAVARSVCAFECSWPITRTGKG